MERHFPAVATVDTFVYLCGGLDELNQPQESCYAYNLIGREWSQMGAGLLNGAISHAPAVSAYDDLYILGGNIEDGSKTDKVNKVLGLNFTSRFNSFG